jgi:hypothetical protein
MNNPFVKPSPLSISRARKVMKTLAWRGVDTPVNLLSELTGFTEAQIRGVLANTDQLNDYLDLPIMVRKKVSRNGHNYYMASVGRKTPLSEPVRNDHEKTLVNSQ